MLRSKEAEQAVRDLARAITEGDGDAIDHLLSTGEVRCIGSDPDEWWGLDRHDVDKVLRQQVEQLAGRVRFEPTAPEGFSDGNIAWVADRVVLHQQDGSSTPFRVTGVLHREGGHWRFTQLHLSVGVRNEDLLGEELPT